MISGFKESSIFGGLSRPAPVSICASNAAAGSLVEARRFVSHRRNPGTGDNVEKTGQMLQFVLQFLNHLFDKEIAERNSAKAILTVRDRIEDCRVRLGGPVATGIFVAVLNQQRWE